MYVGKHNCIHYIQIQQNNLKNVIKIIIKLNYTIVSFLTLLRTSSSISLVENISPARILSFLSPIALVVFALSTLPDSNKEEGIWAN